MPTIADAFNSGLAAMNNYQQGRIYRAQANYADPMEAARLYQLQTQNKYLDPSLAAALSQAQTTAKYLPNQMQLANQYQDLVNQNYTPNIQSEIAFRKAETNKANTMLPLDVKKAQTDIFFTPLDYAIKTQNALRMGSRFGDAYALHQQLMGLPKAARDTWIADHSNEYSTMINTLANSSMNPKTDFLSGLAGKYFPNAVNPDNQAGSSPQGLSAPPVSMPQAIPGAQNNSPNAPPVVKPQFDSTPESLDRMKRAAQISANNDIIPNKAKVQATAAANLDNWLDQNQSDYSQKIKNVSKYAGALGKGSLTLDALKAKNPQAYQDWQWFNNTFKNNIDALITQMEGLSINEGQQKRLIQLSSGMFNNMTTDPESSVKQFNEFIRMAKEISKQRINTAQPLYKDTYKESYGYKGDDKPYVSNPKYSQEDLKKMADDAIAKGADPAAVKKRMQELMNA